ncbi:bifunctional glutamate N-acetyltransferase/amino-acid acetyltransferase ArgJ [Velocimicrobium porci]|uniref:Arginine biosynthesis bifunctional protein ArgJ n=1 Tax=Velocimicrobium porci TaxID=2606634 RepID=A0A6L5Y0S6_9FIRM|nr:bifunctional glutamate N-acetyltransferase/amino-acid acetyltransferase ArgJ [Velocimicrobium porci]MSS64469.1 bifunctional glutamate N-acetyltransferase/amino-acid acetyltransferase ArgJ [Velocimicrobium porci]
MKQIDGGVTAASGFLAAGAAAGIKYHDKTRKDMALVYSKVPAKVAGTFTTNVVKAAPVKRDIHIIKTEETIQAVVINSGIANTCTSKEGELLNEEMAGYTAKQLNLPIEKVLTASTGVIGCQLPIDRVKLGIEKLVPLLEDTKEAGKMAAESIITTDTYKKECAVELEIEGKRVVIGGMAKGSGMIHPNMATMISIVTTDCNISKEMLQKAASADIEDSFHMISVDRDTSTNDTFLLLANGMAENSYIDEEGTAFKAFCEGLRLVTKTLAKLMAQDGEGATKLLEVEVVHAGTKEEAKVLAKSVITSNLVKTAVFGSDANWGRILCALGYAGIEFNPETIELYIQGDGKSLKLYENGMATGYSEKEATEILSANKVHVMADMKMGKEKATAWGCDLSYDYVKINGDYRS